MKRLRSITSSNYKIILEPVMRMQQDGKISRGKRVEFKNHIAEVEDEEYERLKLLPNWGHDFCDAEPDFVPEQKTDRPTVKGMAMGEQSETEKQTRAEIDGLKRQSEALTRAMGQILEKLDSMEKPKKQGKKKKEGDENTPQQQ